MASYSGPGHSSNQFYGQSTFHGQQEMYRNQSPRTSLQPVNYNHSPPIPNSSYRPPSLSPQNSLSGHSQAQMYQPQQRDQQGIPSPSLSDTNGRQQPFPPYGNQLGLTTPPIPGPPSYVPYAQVYPPQQQQLQQQQQQHQQSSMPPLQTQHPYDMNLANGSGNFFPVTHQSGAGRSRNSFGGSPRLLQQTMSNSPPPFPSGSLPPAPGSYMDPRADPNNYPIYPPPNMTAPQQAGGWSGAGPTFMPTNYNEKAIYDDDYYSSSASEDLGRRTSNNNNEERRRRRRRRRHGSGSASGRGSTGAKDMAKYKEVRPTMGGTMALALEKMVEYVRGK